MNMATCSAMG